MHHSPISSPPDLVPCTLPKGRDPKSTPQPTSCLLILVSKTASQKTWPMKMWKCVLLYIFFLFLLLFLNMNTVFNLFLSCFWYFTSCLEGPFPFQEYKHIHPYCLIVSLWFPFKKFLNFWFICNLDEERHRGLALFLVFQMLNWFRAIYF